MRPTITAEPAIISLGRQDYVHTWQAMREYSRSRVGDSADQLWLTEHSAVFTLGQAGRREHILAAGDIPVVQSDRGGQVTYHGPGQCVMYVLLDLRRHNLGVRNLVEMLERVVIEFLNEHGIRGQGRRDAPGVYVHDKKLAALGLRVSKGCSYHGLAINVDNDLEPFLRINPCGFKDLGVTSTSELGINADIHTIGSNLARLFLSQLLGRTPESTQKSD